MDFIDRLLDNPLFWFFWIIFSIVMIVVSISTHNTIAACAFSFTACLKVWMLCERWNDAKNRS